MGERDGQAGDGIDASMPMATSAWPLNTSVCFEGFEIWWVLGGSMLSLSVWPSLFSFVLRFQPLLHASSFGPPFDTVSVCLLFLLPHPVLSSSFILCMHLIFISLFLRLTPLSVFAGEFLRFVFCFCYAVGAMAMRESELAVASSNKGRSVAVRPVVVYVYVSLLPLVRSAYYMCSRGL